MLDRHPILESYRRLQITPWDTGECGPIRDRAFPHSVAADYDGHPERIGFGAFLGWVESMRWWVELADRLSLRSLDRFGLLNVEHQAAGHHCTAWFCTAIPVAIRDSCRDFAAELCSHYFHAYGGRLDGRHLGEREKYLERLSGVGLTANCMPKDEGPMESIYPLDASDENLDRLLAHPHKARADLGPILADPAARERLRIFILADNSD